MKGKIGLVGILAIVVGAAILVGALVSTARAAQGIVQDLFGAGSATTRLAIKETEAEIAGNYAREAEAEAAKAKAEAVPDGIREYWSGYVEHLETQGQIEAAGDIRHSYIYLAESEQRKADQNRTFLYCAITLVLVVGAIAVAFFWGHDITDALASVQARIRAGRDVQPWRSLVEK